MPTATITATEMKDAKVQRISLVERGANRSPFKVVKQEKSMPQDLDLARVFIRKKEQPKPEIVGVVTMKGDTFDSIKAQLEAIGVKVSKSEEPKGEDGKEDGSVVFHQTEEGKIEGELTVVRLSEDVALVCKGFRPYNMDMDVGGGASFAEVCKAQGFYPGVRTMVDVLSSSVLSLAEKSEDPGSAAESIRKMFNEAAEYAVGMVKALPQVAFKMELIEAERVAVNKEETPAGGDGEGDKLPESHAEDYKPESVEKADLSKAPAGVDAKDWVAKSDDDKKAYWADKLKAKKEETPEQKPVVDPNEITTLVAKALSAAMAPLSETLGEVKTSVSTISESVKALDGRVAKAEESTQALSKALDGTVVLGSEGGDSNGQPAAPVRKSESREIDTGFLPRSARRAAAR